MLRIRHIDVSGNSIIVHRTKRPSREQRCKNLVGQHIDRDNAALTCSNVGGQFIWQTEKARSTFDWHAVKYLTLLVQDAHRGRPRDPKLCGKSSAGSDSHCSKPDDRLGSLGGGLQRGSLW